ncbi:hypothetical protein T03_4230, partial [Trichinella britovi]
MDDSAENCLKRKILAGNCLKRTILTGNCLKRTISLKIAQNERFWLKSA